MKKSLMSLLVVALGTGLVLAAETSHELSPQKGTPDGVSKEIAGFLQSDGYRLTGPEGPVCDVWLVKNLFAKPNFSPTLAVKYPLEVGSLVGVLRIPEDSTFTDFRGQELKPGVYTLRYGQQPQDGNHIGTSELRDFLLAIPAGEDESPLPINFTSKLHEKSAKSAGSTHPAILPLLPTDKPFKEASVEHDEENDFWILRVNGQTKKDQKTVQVPIRVVVIGESLI